MRMTSKQRADLGLGVVVRLAAEMANTITSVVNHPESCEHLRASLSLNPKPSPIRGPKAVVYSKSSDDVCWNKAAIPRTKS